MQGDRRCLRDCAIAGAFSLFVGLATAADSTPGWSRAPTKLSQQSLRAALRSLALQRKFQIIFASNEVASLRTQGAVGDLTVDEALDQILSGTGLTYCHLDDSTIAVTSPGKTMACVRAPLPQSIDSAEPRIQQQSQVDASESTAPTVNAINSNHSTTNQSLTKRDTKVNHPSILARIATVFAATFATTAHSQTQPIAGGELEEIVVTANRTASLASKTPITLTAVTGAALADAGITNPTQLAAVAPSVMIQRGNANNLLINIRGVQSTGGTPSVAFLMNGIYIADGAAQEVSLFDINRVEILRGPQGTLYGRNTPGGVVNIIANEPTQRFGGSFDVGYGSYKALQTNAVLNLPASDSLAFRVAANWDMRDSYYKAVIPDIVSPGKDRNNKSVRLSTLFSPAESFKALLVLDYSKMNGDGSNFGLFPLASRFYRMPLVFPAQGQRVPDPVYLNPSASSALSLDVNHQFPAVADNNTWGAASKLEWNLTSGLTAYYEGSYREVNQKDSGTNFFGSQITGSIVTNNLILPISSWSHSKARSHELRLGYDDGPWNAQGGLYFFRQTSDNFIDFDFFKANNPGQYQQSTGIFGQATYSLTDRWRITGGVRNSSDKGGNPTTAVSSNKVTWKVDTDFDLTPAVMAYVTIATGYKQGGVNQNCSQISTPCTIRPETVTDFEGGVKGRYLDGKLSTNIAAFHYNYGDLQIAQVVPLAGGQGAGIATTNAAGAKIDGIELEGNYQYSPQSKFDFTAAWLDARYTNFVIAPSLPTSGNYNGAPLDHAPTWTLSGGYTFTQPLQSGGEFVANFRTHYTSKYVMLSQVANTFFNQPGFTKSNLSLRYNSPNKSWNLEAYVRNIENNVDANYVNTAPLFGATFLPFNNNGKVSTGDPRTVGFRAGYQF